MRPCADDLPVAANSGSVSGNFEVQKKPELYNFGLSHMIKSMINWEISHEETHGHLPTAAMHLKS